MGTASRRGGNNIKGCYPSVSVFFISQRNAHSLLEHIFFPPFNLFLLFFVLFTNWGCIIEIHTTTGLPWSIKTYRLIGIYIAIYSYTGLKDKYKPIEMRNLVWIVCRQSRRRLSKYGINWGFLSSQAGGRCAKDTLDLIIKLLDCASLER